MYTAHKRKLIGGIMGGGCDVAQRDLQILSTASASGFEARRILQNIPSPKTEQEGPQ